MPPFLNMKPFRHTQATYQPHPQVPSCLSTPAPVSDWPSKERLLVRTCRLCSHRSNTYIRGGVLLLRLAVQSPNGPLPEHSSSVSTSLLPQALPVNFTFETNVDFFINAPFQAHTYKHTHRATENKEYGLVTTSENEARKGKAQRQKQNNNKKIRTARCGFWAKQDNYYYFQSLPEPGIEVRAQVGW